MPSGFVHRIGKSLSKPVRMVKRRLKERKLKAKAGKASVGLEDAKKKKLDTGVFEARKYFAEMELARLRLESLREKRVRQQAEFEKLFEKAKASPGNKRIEKKYAKARQAVQKTARESMALEKKINPGSGKGRP